MRNNTAAERSFAPWCFLLWVGETSVVPAPGSHLPSRRGCFGHRAWFSVRWNPRQVMSPVMFAAWLEKVEHSRQWEDVPFLYQGHSWNVLSRTKDCSYIKWERERERGRYDIIYIYLFFIYLFLLIYMPFSHCAQERRRRLRLWCLRAGCSTNEQRLAHGKLHVLWKQHFR